MEIIEYNAIHKQEVIELILFIQKNEFNIPINIEEQPDLKNIETFYQVNNGNFWLAKIDNNIVGTIALLDIENNSVALRKMFVKALMRGKQFGVGQALLNHVFIWAKEKKLNSIFLGTTEKFLAAQRFYEKNGFTEIDEKLLPATFPIMTVDVKFYKYVVTNNL